MKRFLRGPQTSIAGTVFYSNARHSYAAETMGHLPVVLRGILKRAPVRALCPPVSEFQSRRSSRRNQPTQKQEHVSASNCTRLANNAVSSSDGGNDAFAGLNLK
jgi:hypothetical protein